MSTKPLFLLRKAKKSSGEPDVVLWASNDFESTCATLDYLIVKSGKKLSSYFKAVATNFPVVNDLPAEGEIDFTWSERYQLSKDSMTWELKPGAAPDNAHYQGNTNVNGEDMTEIEENMLLPISGQELPIRWLAQHGSEKPVIQDPTKKEEPCAQLITISPCSVRCYVLRISRDLYQPNHLKE